MPAKDPRVIYTEGDEPEPVTPATPLVGLEVEVLKVWLANSPGLRKAYKGTPAQRLDVERAVRAAVFAAWAEEIRLRAQGMTVEQAQEFTRPPMWTPPTARGQARMTIRVTMPSGAKKPTPEHLHAAADRVADAAVKAIVEGMNQTFPPKKT